MIVTVGVRQRKQLNMVASISVGMRSRVLF